MRKKKTMSTETETKTETTTKKPRKVRTPGPKAPNRKASPVAYETFQIDRAAKILRGVDARTVKWGANVSADMGDCDASINDAKTKLAALPADFKAPRGRGGRHAVTFTIGQRVTLSAESMARVNELFPDVAADCVFRIATNAKESDKMLPIVCSGIDGALAPFFVDRAPRKDLTPFVSA